METTGERAGMIEKDTETAAKGAETIGRRAQGETAEGKMQMDFIEAHSLRGLLNRVNVHNMECPSSPILREDIVTIMKEEGTFLLLYCRK